MAVFCPECENPLDLEDELEEGATLQCDECGVELEVVSIDPVELITVDEPRYDDEEPSPISTEDEE